MSSTETEEVSPIDKKNRAYTIVPLVTSGDKLLKLGVIYANGYIQYHNYTDVHPWLFSPEGDKLLFTASYTPPIIFAGRNLLELERHVQNNSIEFLPVYREGYHAPITDTSVPVITAAYFSVLNKDKKEPQIREAKPDIPELPEVAANQG